MDDNWQPILGLVSELKKCDEQNFTTASLAMAFICIDALASLGRAANKERVTRSDFKNWVNTHLIAHESQPYKYRGKDVYAARCAFLHSYGSKAELHDQDPDTIKFAYHDGGKHEYKPEIEKGLVLIGVKSFVNDVVYAVESFLKLCAEDSELRNRAQARLPHVLNTMPFPSQ
ncbi:hypothetical protein [Shewanella surugensis]|uniref:Uncharacterized protein n=1 Tax=Shewanella surugensis TaxID=212020 RepID=A0ABT0LIS2_9GAMM|nr:hypothetical protein [Shewanella surugensis]MCL1127603.1 hypothetical protein [Shewanella surugensis]